MRTVATTLFLRIRGTVPDQAGVTVVEYGLIVAFIGMVFVLAGPVLGTALEALRDTVTGGVNS